MVRAQLHRPPGFESWSSGSASYQLSYLWFLLSLIAGGEGVPLDGAVLIPPRVTLLSVLINSYTAHLVSFHSCGLRECTSTKNWKNLVSKHLRLRTRLQTVKP